MLNESKEKIFAIAQDFDWDIAEGDLARIFGQGLISTLRMQLTCMVPNGSWLTKSWIKVWFI